MVQGQGHWRTPGKVTRRGDRQGGGDRLDRFPKRIDYQVSRFVSLARLYSNSLRDCQYQYCLGTYVWFVLGMVVFQVTTRLLKGQICSTPPRVWCHHWSTLSETRQFVCVLCWYWYVVCHGLEHLWKTMCTLNSVISLFDDDLCGWTIRESMNSIFLIYLCACLMLWKQWRFIPMHVLTFIFAGGPHIINVIRLGDSHPKSINACIVLLNRGS